ncbi:MAG: tetratricopeptide repeat protein, partial [Verrucomicrobiota bacterium]|nr:tetratricopeptide repeat protein [Verrucomicrobiota bacterium]
MRKSVHAGEPKNSWTSWATCAFLVGAVWLLFGRTVTYQFVNFDDEVYVYANPLVTRGLTAAGLLAAFTQSHARNWHPLTTISHMLDCQLFGLEPGGHHAVNVLLHSAVAALLFFALRQMTGRLWPAAFVAAAFALHPLRVESVAWIAERKDVLSGLFFMLTLSAYTRYVHGDVLGLRLGGSGARRGEAAPRPKIASQNLLAPRSRGRYFTVIGFFAAGLLCKPMLVTTPFVLLLLDRWPFDRVGPRTAERRKSAKRSSALPHESWRDLVIEKWPLFVLSILSCGATLIAQHGATGSMESLPVALRIENAIVSVVIYLGQIVWPVNLAPFYPHPAGSLSRFEVLSAAAVLVTISALGYRYRRPQPWLLTGWLWYLIMLVPVIGVVQAGMQARADRYTYLPHIGIFIAISWAVRNAVHRWRLPRLVMIAAAAAYLVAMSSMAWVQIGFWRDSRTLWIHTAEVTRDNEVAENNLGILLEHDGRIDDAISHYRNAVAVQSRRGQARYDLTGALAENNLGNALVAKGETEEAIEHYRKAVELRPDYADGWYNLGVILGQQHQPQRAIACFEKTLALRPNDAAAHGHLGDALRADHADVAARAHYEEAVELEPRAVWSLYSLGWLLATSPDASVRDGDRALQLAQKALELPKGENGAVLRLLAAAYG